MLNISRTERVWPLLQTRVVLEVICSVDDGNAVVVAVGGGEEYLRRRKTVGGKIPAVVDPSVIEAAKLGWTTAQQEWDKPRKVSFENYL